jgi:8-oxo-dGTP diphosphatase
MEFTYNYPRPAVTADIIILKSVNQQTSVLLIERKNPPFEGKWALPGGFMEMDETLENTALRELFEETGIKGVELQQFHTFSKVDRDPRHRTITTVFWGNANEKTPEPQAGDDAANVQWFPVQGLPPLAFDHEVVMRLLLTSLGF